jgi:deoxyribose-phosphate aldolase
MKILNKAKMIDHTLLKADATKAGITTILEEAKEYGFASVCVNPTWVAYAAEQLQE